MSYRVPALLLALAAAAWAGAAEPVEVYKSPEGYAGAGDFSFSYSTGVVVLQDFVYLDAKVGGALHTIVLRARDADPSGDLRSIEINNLRSLKQRLTCGDYSVCRVVDGIVIGTNSEDPAFRKIFDQVAGSFKRR